MWVHGVPMSTNPVRIQPISPTATPKARSGSTFESLPDQPIVGHPDGRLFLHLALPAYPADGDEPAVAFGDPPKVVYLDDRHLSER